MSVTLHIVASSTAMEIGAAGLRRGELVQGIGALESSAKSGSVEEAKKSFVTLCQPCRPGLRALASPPASRVSRPE